MLAKSRGVRSVENQDRRVFEERPVLRLKQE
jgi:hypothetical protein